MSWNGNPAWLSRSCSGNIPSIDFASINQNNLFLKLILCLDRTQANFFNPGTPCLHVTIWLPSLPPILGQEGIFSYLQQGQLIITTSVKISLVSHIPTGLWSIPKAYPALLAMQTSQTSSPLLRQSHPALGVSTGILKKSSCSQEQMCGECWNKSIKYLRLIDNQLKLMSRKALMILQTQDWKW